MFRTRNIPAMDFELLDKWLGKNNYKKLAHETYVERLTGDNPPDNIRVTLFGHEILTYTRDGNIFITVYNDYRRSATTKQRLNRLLPFNNIYQEDHDWYLTAPKEHTYKILHGWFVVNSYGYPTLGSVLEERLKRVK